MDKPHPDLDELLEPTDTVAMEDAGHVPEDLEDEIQDDETSDA